MINAIKALIALVAILIASASDAKTAPPPWRYTLRALESLPVHKTDADEDPTERTARLTRYAQHLHAVTRSRHERALLIAVALHESHFSRAVCEGGKLGDNGKAWGCWQSWEKDRSGGVKGQAQRAIRHLRVAENFCRARHRGKVNRVTGAVSLYATGKTCVWPGAKKRLATYKKVLARL